jgi:hypothetical protein
VKARFCARIRRHQPDYGPMGLGSFEYRAENARLLRTAKPFKEGESPVNYSTDPVIPSNSSVHRQNHFNPGRRAKISSGGH